MHEVEPDRRLHRLLILSDGVFAISLTLLAVQLALPEGSQDLQGGALLPALLATWPRVLAYLNSFAVIAIFWQAHHRLFLQVRRFDGILLWLVFLQLGCIGFIPFPTAVIGEHGTNPVAQQFYFATLLLTGLVMVALWWYMNSGRRLVHPDLSPQFVRRTHLISLILPAILLILMGLVAVGIGSLINPLLLFALATFCFIVLGVIEWRNEEAEAGDAGQQPAPADTAEEGSEVQEREAGGEEK
jgi:uncharacterized membrane protein